MRARMIALMGAVIGVISTTVAMAEAQTHKPVVIELFTSQGCSACPPADAFMAELAPRDDVIALALHVDYWDYLGWKDPFAHSRHTERQKTYARAAGSKMIYTPQIIVDGMERVEGLQARQITDLIRRNLSRPSPVTLHLDRVGNMVRIAATAVPPLAQGVMVQIVRYRPSATTTIERGENAGRTETYHNIVTSWEPLAEWAGDMPLLLDVRAEGDDPVVVILQEHGPGTVVAAARLR